MSQLITQDELDTLLASIHVAEAQRRQQPESATAALYDFRHAAKLSPEHMRALRNRVVSLATVLSRTLTAYLSQPTELTVHSLDLASYEQYVRNLASRPILGVVSCGQGTPQALWEMSPDLARVALSCMLGGQPVLEPEAAEELPPLGRAVLSRLFREILSSWTELWPPLKAVRPKLEGVVCSPGANDAHAGEERLLYVIMEAGIAQHRGLLRLCLPLSVVRRLLREDKGPAGAQSPRPAPHEAATSGPLADTPVDVSVELQPAPIPLSALLCLQPGETLDLRLHANTPFTVKVGDVPRFTAQAGVSSGKVAAKLITEMA